MVSPFSACTGAGSFAVGDRVGILLETTQQGLDHQGPEPLGLAQTHRAIALPELGLVDLNQAKR